MQVLLQAAYSTVHDFGTVLLRMLPEIAISRRHSGLGAQD